jgi:hypothetical protein
MVIMLLDNTASYDADDNAVDSKYVTSEGILLVANKSVQSNLYIRILCIRIPHL